MSSSRLNRKNISLSYEVRMSSVHGRGVFATRRIEAGERIVEYIGEIITWKEALRRHPHDPLQPHHTFYFHINSRRVIDAKHGGNDARWINHSCAPNAQAEESRGRIFIEALRTIEPDEEIQYDYGLTIDEPWSQALVEDYPCWCGATCCRGTLLHFDEEHPLSEKPAKKPRAVKKASPSTKASWSEETTSARQRRAARFAGL